MTAFSVDSLSEGLKTALGTADKLGASDAATVTVAVCLARRIDRLIAEDEPVSAALMDSYCRALIRLGLMAPAAGRKTSSVTVGRLAELRASHNATRRSA